MPSGPFIFRDCFFSWNAVDLSDQIKEIRIRPTRTPQDDTVMGDTTESSLAGLKNWELSIEFVQNFDAAKVDATIFPDWDAGTNRTWLLRASKTEAIGTPNPQYSATGWLRDYAPIGGRVGEFAMAPAVIVPGGSAPAIARATV